MKFWLGVTDNKWFDFLSRQELDEVNFWQPSAKPLFKEAPVGMPFLFKLKRPYNHIGGGGFFVAYSTLPLSLAWEIFGIKNGANSLDELKALIKPLSSSKVGDPDIGCTVLSNPFFLEKQHWLENPPGWAGNIVRGKMYESQSEDGSLIWQKMSPYFSAPINNIDSDQNYISNEIHEKLPKFGEPVLVKPRLGQSSFRMTVTDAYNRRCAMTGENTLVVLEAAHIIPYAKEGTHSVKNGLLLRSDFHKLFDVGLISVTPEYKIRISPRIKETWFNGKVYYRLDNQPLTVMPEKINLRPDPDYLQWHYKNVFQA
ncbi:MAG: HNH endonuclease [Methylococcaceae bacterium]